MWASANWENVLEDLIVTMKNIMIDEEEDGDESVDEEREEGRRRKWEGKSAKSSNCKEYDENYEEDNIT